mgnify:CR=1 FL=1
MYKRQPDTQYYTGELNGGTNEMFKSQTQWIINNMDSLHIVFAEGLGDCVQNGDNGNCLLYTSDAADERSSVDLGGRRIIKKKNNRKISARRYTNNNK